MKLNFLVQFFYVRDRAKAGYFHLEQQDAPTRTVLRLVVGGMRANRRFRLRPKPTSIALGRSEPDEEISKFLALALAFSIFIRYNIFRVC